MALQKYAPSYLTITPIRAFGLANLDMTSKSDPYVAAWLAGKESEYVMTPTVANSLTPSWGMDLSLEGATGEDVLVLRVADDDSARTEGMSRSDDTLGEVRIPLSGLSNGRGASTFELANGRKRNKQGGFGQIQLMWSRSLNFPNLNELDGREAVEKVLSESLSAEQLEVVRKELDESIALIMQELAPLSPRPADVAEPTPVPMSTGPLVREEIRGMPEAEVMRYVAAVKTAMQYVPEGKDVSEWFRVAGYHGWPSNDGKGYCAHRAEHFPGWHRAYLMEMEAVLQEADKINGNDGRITQPYWDFSVSEKHGQVLPSLILEHFGSSFDFPANFFDSVGLDNPLAKEKFSGLRSGNALVARLRNSDIAGLASECLDQDNNHEHWMHASTENNRGTPVESPHNQAHVALGFPLTSLSYAAFHPMFWLLHCNVDRIYEGYVRGSPGRTAEVLREMREHQNLAERRGLTNLMREPLAPFTNKTTGQPFMLEDTVSTIPLGYVFDRLPASPAPQLRALPTLVMFKNVDVVRNLTDTNGNLKSFSMHIFLVPEGADGPAVPTDGNVDAFPEHPHYAGIVGVFGGKGPKCKNCAETKPVTYRKDISSKMADLGVTSRHGLSLAVVAEDEMGLVCAFDQLQATFGDGVVVPTPQIVGPVFEKGVSDLMKFVDEATTVDTTTSGNVKQLQRYLARFGYYDGAVDGMFQGKTEDALKEFQEANGLLSDGVAGQVTKAQISASLNDGGSHKRADDTRVFPAGAPVKYFLGPSPGYLDRQEYEAVVAASVAQWAEASGGGLTFEACENDTDVNMKFLFGVPHTSSTDAAGEEADILQFDGPGGELARADGVDVIFDTAERWKLSAEACLKPGDFNLAAVCLHEVGHVIGLAHSRDPLAVMSPYYSRNQTALMTEDKERTAALYST